MVAGLLRVHRLRVQLDELAVRHRRAHKAHAAVEVRDGAAAGGHAHLAHLERRDVAAIGVLEGEQVQAALVVTEQESLDVQAHGGPALHARACLFVRAAGHLIENARKGQG